MEAFTNTPPITALEPNVRHPIPTDAKRAAYDLHTESGRVLLCQNSDVTTVPALESALSASKRLRRLAATMETALRRQIATARQAERELVREAEKAERRNDAIRRERGLPTRNSDLAIPEVAA